MRNSPRLMKAIASILTITITMMPFYSTANESPEVDTQDFLSQIGREGQSLGKQLGSEAVNTPAKVQNGQMTIPTKDDNGNLNYEGGESFSVDSLYPGTNPKNSSKSSEYFTDGKTPEMDALKGVYDSDDDMSKVGKSSKSSLWEDANSDTPSISGAAYKVLLDASNMSKPDFDSDPLLNSSKGVYENIDVIAEGFGDCKEDTFFENNKEKFHKPEYKTCDRLYKPSGNCTIKHTIEILPEKSDIVFLIDNSASMGSVIADLRNNVRSFAQILSRGDKDKIRLGGAAFRERDYKWNKVNLTPKFNSFKRWLDRVRTKGARTYPFDVVNWAANHYKWRDDVRKVIVLIGNDDTGGNKGAARRALASKGIDLFTFHNNPNVKSLGKPLADYFSGPLLLKFAQELTIVKDNWGPQSCINDGIASLEEFCSGTYKDVPSKDNNCVTLSGFKVCKGDPIYKKLGEPPLPNVYKLAKEVHVSALDCSFNHGTGSCWIDMQGNEQCLENREDIDQCKQYEENPECGFISSKCVEGAKGSRGNCYVNEETYDCGYDVEVDNIEKNTKYQCSGEIRCMGDDCLGVNKTQSSDFARASALLNAAQFMTQDMTCEDATGESNTYCKAFSGDAGECKVAVGGVADCCEKPSNVSMADYLTMLYAVPKLDSAITSLSDKNVVRSAYEVLREPAVESWTKVTKPFTNYMDNISGVVQEIWTPIEQAKDKLVEAISEKAKEVFQETIGSLAEDKATEEMTKAATSEATESALENVSANAMSALNTVSTIYTAYVVTIAVIKMIYKCEKEELELNSKRAIDSCVHVGTYCKDKILGVCIEKRQGYCCFNSPLSRIIQEQVRPQLNKDFGTAKNPSCGGIPIDKMSDINWDNVNLDEWVAILKKNGRFPEPGNVSMESITGKGSALSIDGSRLPSDKRAIKKLEDLDIDKKRKKIRDNIDINRDGKG